MIITIIIHNKYDDESHSQQKSHDNANYQTYSITFLIESLHKVQFDQKQRQTNFS
jgi:hypothetical protein